MNNLKKQKFLTNNKKLEIIDNIINLAKSRNLINLNCEASPIKYYTLMQEERLIFIKPLNKNINYVWPFYVEHDDFIQLVFPTPPYKDETNSDFDKLCDQFILDTRNCINEILSKNPKKIVLDLQNNIGGYIHVFYDSLWPLMPKSKERIKGINKYGKLAMKLYEENGIMVLQFKEGANKHKLKPCQKFAENCEIEVWVNKKSASSSEIMMIIFEQEGCKIIGKPTMGLTTGMTNLRLNKFSVNIPTYFFADKNGNIYKPNLAIDIQEKKNKIKYNTYVSEFYDNNVLIDLPNTILEVLKPNSNPCFFNNIHIDHFNNNFHSCIKYDKNYDIQIIELPKMLYVFVPQKCKKSISSYLPKKINKPILIDVRNAKLKNKKCLKIFDGFYKPWTTFITETSHTQADQYDKKFNKLDKSNLLNKYVYISNKFPYITDYTTNEIGQFANINAKIWINKNSFFGDINSALLQLYLIANFGTFEESELNPNYMYSLFKYELAELAIYLYTDKFNID